MSHFPIGIRNPDGTYSDVSLNSPLPITSVASASSVTGMVSTNNSTTANLAGAATFTGVGDNIAPFGSASVYVYSSHASATNGLSIQQSHDNINWFLTDTFSVAATTAKTVQVPRQALYVRVVYTNGATLTTTLIIQTILNTQMARGASQKPVDAMTLENDFDQVISVPALSNGTSLDVERSITNGANTIGTGVPAAALMAQFDDASIVATTENSFSNLRMSSDHILYVAGTPTASAGVGLVSSFTTLASSAQVVKASAGNLYAVNVVSGASAGYLMIFNSTTAPADGTVTPVKSMAIGANASINLSFSPPLRFSTGITVVFSTTGPFTKTASATAFISGDAV